MCNKTPDIFGLLKAIEQLNRYLVDASSSIQLTDVAKILDSGSSSEKIAVLESLIHADDMHTIQKIILMLDDADIAVTGEAFSSLMLNDNNISKYLIDALYSESKNVRAHASLILANRKEHTAIRDIARLAGDRHPAVRACALGALGHLKAQGMGTAIRTCLTDPDMEVRKSAIKAAIDTGEHLSEDVIQELLLQKDPEIKRLITHARQM